MAEVEEDFWIFAGPREDTMWEAGVAVDLFDLHEPSCWFCGRPATPLDFRFRDDWGSFWATMGSTRWSWNLRPLARRSERSRPLGRDEWPLPLLAR